MFNTEIAIGCGITHFQSVLAMLGTFCVQTHLINGNYQPIISAEETMENKVKSDFLFAQPSLASGAARVLDLWGQFDDYNQSETTLEADARAIATDWLIVGQDLSDAIEYHEDELPVA
jgi:hypothetical protein